MALNILKQRVLSGKADENFPHPVPTLVVRAILDGIIQTITSYSHADQQYLLVSAIIISYACSHTLILFSIRSFSMTSDRMWNTVVPGMPGPISSIEEFVNEYGLPVIIKAAMGGGGCGIRVIRSVLMRLSLLNRKQSRHSEMEQFSWSNFSINHGISKYNFLADEEGNVVHLYERDCSVQ